MEGSWRVLGVEGWDLIRDPPPTALLSGVTPSIPSSLIVSPCLSSVKSFVEVVLTGVY